MLRLILAILIFLTGLNGGVVAQREVLVSELLFDQQNYNFVFDRMQAQIEVAPNRINDKKLEGYLKATLCRLSPQHCNQIQIYILDQPEFNAYMLPNGALIVLTGLLLRIDNQAQLAYILAHELAHYIHNHGIKRINNKKFANSTFNQVGDFNPVKEITGLGKNISVNNFSRQLENEADLFSIELLSNSKFPLIEVAIMFENLRKENVAVNRVNTGGYSASHPGTKQRIRLFEKEAHKHTISQFKEDDSWIVVKAKFVGQWLDSELSKREFKSTLVLLNRLKRNSRHPGYYDYYLGEIYRKQGGEKNTKIAITYYQAHLNANNSIRLSRVFKSLGDSYSELNRPDIAREYYNQYIKSSPQANDVDIVRSELVRL